VTPVNLHTKCTRSRRAVTVLQLYFLCIKMHRFSNRVFKKRKKVITPKLLDTLFSLSSDHVIKYLSEFGGLKSQTKRR
jgi:hypothetical protein